MTYVTPNQIAKAKQIDIITYFNQYEPGELVRINNRVYTTRSHDSLKISNGMWCWWSRGVGGKTALDYLIKVRGLAFTDAVEYLSNCPTPMHFPQETVKAEEQRIFKLPKAYKNNYQVIAYLIGRGIDKKLLHKLISENKLYEDEHHNCVFVGFDVCKAKYAMLRGTHSNFMMDVEGSDKRFAFFLSQNENTDILQVFESVIDLLSKLSRDKNRHISGHYLSISGVSRYTKIPVALESYLERNPKIRCINICFDNDDTGKQASQTLKELLQEKYDVQILVPPKGKDWNDCLVLENKIKEEQR